MGQVVVKNTLFSHCGVENDFQWPSEHACIQVAVNGDLDVAFDVVPVSLKLSCIGNIFENNLGFPIAERILHPDLDGEKDSTREPRYIPNTELYELKNNQLR